MAGADGGADRAQTMLAPPKRLHLIPIITYMVCPLIEHPLRASTDPLPLFLINPIYAHSALVAAYCLCRIYRAAGIQR
eukprot:3915864-Pleurochrysis_carterae.AAC.3